MKEIEYFLEFDISHFQRTLGCHSNTFNDFNRARTLRNSLKSAGFALQTGQPGCLLLFAACLIR